MVPYPVNACKPTSCSSFIEAAVSARTRLYRASMPANNHHPIAPSASSKPVITASKKIAIRLDRPRPDGTGKLTAQETSAFMTKKTNARPNKADLPEKLKIKGVFEG